MANLIQIKRSATNAVIPTLQPGEMAFTQSGNTLYIGAPDGSSGNIRIGGKETPGTLTANQALVANSTSGINNVIAANIDVGIIRLSGDPGQVGYILSSNGTGPAFWSPSAGVDPAANYTWTALHIFQANATFNAYVYANSVNAVSFTTGASGTGTGGIVANTTTIFIGNNSVNSILTSAGLNVNGASVVNNSGVYVTTANAASFTTGGYGEIAGGFKANDTHISIGNTSVNGYISTNSTVAYFTGTTNLANNASYVGGNSASDLRLYTENMACTAYSNAVTYAGTKAGDAYTNAMADTLGFSRSYTGNNIFGGTNTVINSNTIFNSNNLVYFKNSANAVFGDITSYMNIISISANLNSGSGGFRQHGPAIAIGSSGAGPGGVAVFAPLGAYSTGGSNVFFVNSSILQIGSATSSSDGAYSNIIGGAITFNSAGGGSATINSTMYTGSTSSANNASYLGTIAAANYVQNTDSRTLSGNLTFTGTNTVFNSNVVFNGRVANNFIPTANVTYSLGNTSLRWSSLYVGGTTIYLGDLELGDSSGTFTVRGGSNSINSNTIQANTISGISSANLNISSNTVFGSGVSNIEATSALLRVRDVIVSGNLVVSGTLTSINTQTLIVNDNIIELASNNNLATSDVIDIGWYAVANSGGTINYPALGRIATNSTATNPYFKLFTQTSNPNTASTFTPTSTGSLEAYLLPYGTGGAFVANSTVVNITANSTVSSTITANSMTLSTALAAGSGGTGFKTYTAGQILYANSSNLLDKLSLGTEGKVLQSNGTALVYDILDGGSF